MANRLSLQSATCSAFQLQLCRQPHNENDTKTVSSFGSDCTRAMQSPPRNPTTWWAITRLQLIHRLCSCLRKNSMNEKEIWHVFIFLCLCIHLHSMPLYSTVWHHASLSKGRGGVSYCSAVMYPSSFGVHCTPATSTLSCSSEKDRPRFKPWMVTRVPPSRGPATGLTYVGEKKELKLRWCVTSCIVVLIVSACQFFPQRYDCNSLINLLLSTYQTFYFIVCQIL